MNLVEMRPGIERASQPARKTLGSAVASGVVWTMACVLLGKCIAACGQVALGWVLGPQEVGLASVAQAAAFFAVALTSFGWREVVLRIDERDSRQLTQVLWISATLGSIAAVVVWNVAGWVSVVWAHGELRGLVRLLSATLVMNAVSSVYAGMNARALRFREAALISLCAIVSQSAVTLSLAIVGYGARAVIAGLCSSAAVMLVGQRWVAGPVRPARPDAKAWLQVLPLGATLAVANAANGMQVHGATLAIGYGGGARSAGLFSWSYMLASQASYLLGAALTGVLAPSFARLSGDLRAQGNALEKAGVAMSAVCAPIGVLQALLAKPAIALVFGERWWDAAPLVACLSASLLFSGCGAAAAAVLLANGRYRTAAAVALARCGVCVGLAAIGASRAPAYGAGGFALGALAFSIVEWCVGSAAIGRPVARSIRAPAVIIPVVCLVCAGPAILTRSYLSEGLVSMLVVSVLFAGAYCGALAWWFAPVWGMLRAHAARLAGRPATARPIA